MRPQDQKTVLENALHELADKVRVSKANYQGAEHASIRGMSATDDEGVTTMPAPGTPPRGLSDFG
ncbi:hypothetical protein AB0N62_23350 [Streptomyces sp. NPDC093982]|uniref:hypothetical protein n=1 Tax=Streptomyces sp. NPDC093982 TaxID=3155077 RepID=UPI0034264464